MKVKTAESYYYTAQILRKGKRVTRQGTINALSKDNALDKVYEMARQAWKRAVFEVVILDVSTGETLVKSTIGEYSNRDKSKDDDDSGFVPWNEPLFRCSSIGTFFIKKRFNTY